MPGTAHVTGLRARRWFLDELGKVFERFDLLVHPEMPVVPPPIDDLTVELGGERMPYRLALIPFNSPWSLAGVPAASVPAGLRRRSAARPRDRRSRSGGRDRAACRSRAAIRDRLAPAASAAGNPGCLALRMREIVSRVAILCAS